MMAGMAGMMGQMTPMQQMQLLQQQQMQAQMMAGGGAAAAAGGAAASGDPGVGSAQQITVSGCSHATVGNIVRGSFTMVSQNHGKPVYKKDAQVNGLEVMLYFWDERDGQAFSGWWFGPKVGGDQVWAFQPLNNPTPPKTGWKVPCDGPVDPTFVIAAGGVAGLGAAQFQQQWAQQMQKGGGKGAMAQQASMQQKQAQLAKIEQMKQQQEQLKAKQEAEKARREEVMKKAKATQASTMNIRRVINKLRTCTSKDFETTEQELNQILATDLVNCGAQMAKIKEEAETALKAAHDRIGLLRQKMAEAEQRKAEAEKKKAEAVEHAKELMKQLENMVEASEGAALVVKQKHEALQKEDIKFSVAEKTAVAMDEAVEAAKKCCSEASAFLKEQNPKMRVPGASENIEISKTISELVAKNSARSKEVDQASKEAKTLFAKIEKKEGAKKKMNTITAKFIKYDKNKDSHFNKAEVKAYASGEFKFKVGDDALNSIFSHWATDLTKGIAKDSFQRVKMGVGLAREMAKDSERKKARLEKEAKVEKLKEESKEKIEELAKGIQETEEQVKKPESYAQPLLAKAAKMEIAEMNTEADEVEKQVTSAKEEIAKTKEAIKGLLEDCDEDLTAWMTQEVKKLELKTKTWDPRMTKASTIGVKLREMGKRKEQAELEALEAKALSIIRYHQQQEKLDFDALFSSFDKDKDEKVSQDEFVAFFADCKKPKEKKEGEEGEGTDSIVAEDDLKKVFAHLDDDGEGSLNKPRFEAITRYRMKVVLAAPMTKELKSDSEEVRKLAKGEVVEVIEGPMEEPDTKTLRVKAKALKDDVEGYVSVKSHTGNTAFLRDGGRVYRVVKETLITDEFDLDTMEEGKSRKLKVNEQVEVKEVPRKDEKTGMLRMRCKAKSDGRVGWATIQGNAGTVFMEAA